MISSIQDIPKVEKKVPSYLSPELMAQKALISAIGLAIRDMIGNIQVNVDIPTDKCMNVKLDGGDCKALQAKEVVIPSEHTVVGQDEVIKLLGDLKAVLGRLPQKFPEIVIPEAPKSVEVSNMPSIPSVDLARVEALLEDVKTALMAVEPKESVKVENLGDIQIPQVDYDLIASIVASMQTEALDIKPLIKSIEDSARYAPTASHPSFVDPDGEPNRAKMDTNRVLRTSSDGYKKRITYTSSGKVEYVGVAVTGSATSDDTWQISKLSYDGSDRLIAVDYADDSDKFEFVWDDKEDYF